MFSKEKKELKAKEAAASASLRQSIRAGDLAGVQSILSGEARQHIAINDNNVYLHLAVREGTPEILEALLQAGADPREKFDKATTLYADQHRTPLRMAVEWNKIDMARVLLKDPRTEDPDYEPHVTTARSSPSNMGPSVRRVAESFNNAAAWNDLFDLADARRFMAKFKKAQEILEKAGELPKSDTPKPKGPGGLNL